MRKRNVAGVPAIVAHASGVSKPILAGAPLKIMCARKDCHEIALIGDRLCVTHRVAMNEVKARERGDE